MVSGWFILHQTVILGLHFHVMIYWVLDSLFLDEKSRKAIYFGPSSVHKTAVGFQLNLGRHKKSERPQCPPESGAKRRYGELMIEKYGSKCGTDLSSSESSEDGGN